MKCSCVAPSVQEKDCVCYFWFQPLFGAFLSVKGTMIFINVFHHRWFSSGLIHPWGFCLCLDVWSEVFLLIFIYVDVCCLLHHGQIKVLEAK